jgi:hypothetical protein
MGDTATSPFFRSSGGATGDESAPSSDGVAMPEHDTTGNEMPPSPWALSSKGRGPGSRVSIFVRLG